MARAKDCKHYIDSYGMERVRRAVFFDGEIATVADTGGERRTMPLRDDCYIRWENGKQICTGGGAMGATLVAGSGGKKGQRFANDLGATYYVDRAKYDAHRDLLAEQAEFDREVDAAINDRYSKEYEAAMEEAYA